MSTPDKQAQKEWTATSVWRIMGEAAIDNRLLMKVADAHNASIAVEREQFANATKLAAEALSDKHANEIQQLRTQLAQAQAAMREIQASGGSSVISRAHTRNLTIADKFLSGDTDALDSAIEEAIANQTGPELLKLLMYPSRQYALDSATKPYVEMLEKLYAMCRDGGNFGVKVYGHSLNDLANQIDALLAKEKQP